MSAIFRRELGAFFTSGIAYVFLAVFYLLAGLFFYMYTLSSSTTDMSGMFSMLFAVIIFLIPILTMKSFSEEKKQKYCNNFTFNYSYLCGFSFALCLCYYTGDKV